MPVTKKRNLRYFEQQKQMSPRDSSFGTKTSDTSWKEEIDSAQSRKHSRRYFEEFSQTKMRRRNKNFAAECQASDEH